MQVDLQGRIIFITGGTSILGRAFVRAAVDAGARVCFSYLRNTKEAESLKETGAFPLRLDLANLSEITLLKAQLKETYGRLDALVNNAAAVHDGTVGNLTREDWDHVLNVDLGGIFHLSRALLPLLYRSERGKVLNLTSRLGLRGAAGAANYAAAKAGVVAFTKTLAMETGRKGILVNALNPGFMLSNMTEGLPQKARERGKEESLLETYSDPKEVAEFMVYLLSDRCRSVTGQIFHYDSRPI